MVTACEPTQQFQRPNSSNEWPAGAKAPLRRPPALHRFPKFGFLDGFQPMKLHESMVQNQVQNQSPFVTPYNGDARVYTLNIFKAHLHTNDPGFFNGLPSSQVHMTDFAGSYCHPPSVPFVRSLKFLEQPNKVSGPNDCCTGTCRASKPNIYRKGKNLSELK